jgi:hypothetical protein
LTSGGKITKSGVGSQESGSDKGSTYRGVSSIAQRT